MEIARRSWGWVLVIVLTAAACGMASAEAKEGVSLFKAGEFSTYQSEYSPAVLLDTDSGEVTIFHRLSEWGLEGPTHIAIPTKEGIKVSSGKDMMIEEDLSESWLLVWFCEGEGWDKVMLGLPRLDFLNVETLPEACV